MVRNLSRSIVLAALTSLVGGCPTNNGTDPPNDRFFFPTAAVLHRPAPDQDADFLYVISADFDLAYNGSAIATVDLARMRARMADHNGCFPDPNARDAWICSETSLIRTEFARKLNPYAIEATIATYRDRTTGVAYAQRLYTIVRGGNALAWFDIRSDGSLDCGTPDDRGYCAADHYAGNDPAQSPTALRLPQETSAISVDPERGWIVLTHQSSSVDVAHASLMRDPIAVGPAGEQGVTHPVLLSTLGGTAPGLSSLTLMPRIAGSTDRSTWLATSRTSPALTLLQAYPGNTELGDNRAFLYLAASTPIQGLNSGANSRTIVLDPDVTAKRAFVMSRSPEALLTLDTSNPSAPTITDVTPLPSGPGRVMAVYHPALRQTYVYATAYDARWIYVIDPDDHRVIDQIATNRGPHAMVLDDRAGMLFVVDFIDSSVEVIDVRPVVNDSPNPAFNHRVLTFGRLGARGTAS
jgi:hypothetical protein